MGTLVSADREIGTMQVEIDNRGGKKNPTRKMTVTCEPNRMPSNMKAGSLVRIWGKYGEKRQIFKARHIRTGFSSRRIDDPTGVRSRLRKDGGRPKMQRRKPHMRMRNRQGRP